MAELRGSVPLARGRGTIAKGIVNADLITPAIVFAGLVGAIAWNLGLLLQVVWVSLVAGVGVSALFSLVIVGGAKASEGAAHRP